MTDRELLEAAAKAAGYDLAWGGPDGDMARRKDTWDNWNPLTDDGDALRLLVELAGRDMVRVEIGRAGASVEFDSSPMFGQVVDKDRKYAVRLAIVRAAAELGKEGQPA